MRRARLIVVILALVLLPAGIYAAVTRDGASAEPITPGLVHAPDGPSEGVRIRVEVRNASTVPGLARRATFHLRDLGFDVVESGNAVEKRDSTLVLDRSGHPQWSQLVAKAMGGARVIENADSALYVDVTVLVGPGWRPPPEPFYP
ncbi:MAG TPA: LytR C-terminal domain-containing protein [Gemmatimonadaceae bacterium]|jgi:hypothetical protein